MSAQDVPRHASPRLAPPATGLILLAGILGAVGALGPRPIVPLDAVDVQMLAHDLAWHASYRIARTDGAAAEVPTGREVHVPLGADVRLGLASRDYVSSFTLPGLGLRDFAAPGLPSEFRFRAERPGRYALRGEELCGRPHTEKSRGWLVIEDPDAYRTWVERRARGLTG